MKTLTRRFLTLFLGLCLLLSVAAPAFAIDIRYAPRPPKSEAMQKDVEEQPFPNVAGKPRYFLFIPSFTANSFLFYPALVRVSISPANTSSLPLKPTLKAGYVE